MTNKPMLSVERELIERAVKACTFVGYEDAAKELRALLDKPAAECKPFAWYRVPKDFPLQGAFFPYIEVQSERDIQSSLEAEFGFNVKRLYDEPAAQHQGEPVTAQIRFRRPERGCPDFGEWHYLEMSRFDKHRTRYIDSVGWECETRALYAEQPAPVAVVMPERESFDIDDWAGSFCQEALSFGMSQDVFARCVRTAIDRTLAEVARLNGVKP